MVLVAITSSYFAEWLLSIRGTLGPTAMQSNSPINAIFAVVFVTIIGASIGSIIAKYTTTNSGMFVFGFAYFILAMNLVGVEEFILMQGNVWLLVVEALFVSCLILLGTLLIFSVGGPMKDVAKAREEPIEIELGTGTYTLKPDNNTWVKIICLSLVILPVVWLVAQSPMHGQVIGATAVGGLAIGLLARKILPSLQPVVLFALPVAMASIGYILGMQLSEVTDVAFMQRSLSGFLYPMPLEYAGGAVIGVSIGLNWGASTASSAPKTSPSH